MKYKVLSKTESELHPEKTHITSYGPYNSKEQAMHHAMWYAGNDKYSAFKELRMIPENVPKVKKTKDTVSLIISGVGEDYDNITITYYLEEIV